tara:strand:- start:437 stop:961 length:525 start_codon:yes stop_codon:yes gene_type:complete
MDGDIELLNIVIIGIVLTVVAIGALIYKFLIKPRRKVKIGNTFASPLKGNEEAADDLPATLPAYVWRRDGMSPELIKKPVGTLWFADPSLPVSGPCYLCTVDKNGGLVAYDPRVAAIEEGNAPQDLYEAILCPEVFDFYTSTAGLWEKVKTLLPYIIAGGLLLIALAMTDSIGG